MTKTFTAQFIASAITANCAQYFADEITRAEWDAEQRRLWDMADAKRISGYVKAILFPPTFAVRQQLREQTLKVGR